MLNKLLGRDTPAMALPERVRREIGPEGPTSKEAAMATYLEHANITVPAGFAFGLPVGVSFWGRAWSEPTLLRIAYGFEQATNHRQPPRFLRTAAL